MQNHEIDAKLIAALGGPTKVAALLDMQKAGGSQRVQNWLKRGIPAAVKLRYPQIFLKKMAGDTEPPVADSAPHQA